MHVSGMLAGRVALVTGANHGIGAAIAHVLSEAGADIGVSSFHAPLSEAERTLNDGVYAAARMRDAGEVVRACRSQGVRAIAVPADLSDVSQIEPLFEHLEAALGPVDILVNNAAAWQADTFAPPDVQQRETWVSSELQQALTAASIDRHFAVNTRAVALLMAMFASRHRQRGAVWGRIINITTGGAACFPGEASYGASKYAMESYSRTAARELGPLGITVNLVVPGPTQTGWIDADTGTELAARTPLRRVGMPDDIARAVLLLASPMADWITGQRLAADGGFGT
jgi:3-oxoacyl-[acyl-carrier protein] reductase